MIKLFCWKKVHFTTTTKTKTHLQLQLSATFFFYRCIWVSNDSNVQILWPQPECCAVPRHTFTHGCLHDYRRYGGNEPCHSNIWVCKEFGWHEVVRNHSGFIFSVYTSTRRYMEAINYFISHLKQITLNLQIALAWKILIKYEG